MVLQILQLARLTANPRKCRFSNAETEFSRQTVGGGVVKPSTAKVHEIVNYPRPISKKNVQAFMGLVGYYGYFIQNAGLAEPNRQTTIEKAPEVVEWSPNAEPAFEFLKEALRSAPI